jgi:multiple antibiotic resistance protein
MGGIDTGKLMQDAITLFVVINPFGAVPHYLALTRGRTRQERLRIARRGCTYAAIILLVFIALGELVLDGLHVGLPSFRAAGGLILLIIALRTVLNTAVVHPLAQTEMGGKADVAVFPLATPFLAGPGAIIAAVLLTENDVFSLAEQAVTSLIAVSICVFAYVVLASSDYLQKHLGDTGTSVMSRIFGLVLAALAVQMLLDGLRPYLQSLH